MNDQQIGILVPKDREELELELYVLRSELSRAINTADQLRLQLAEQIRSGGLPPSGSTQDLFRDDTALFLSKVTKLEQELLEMKQARRSADQTIAEKTAECVRLRETTIKAERALVATETKIARLEKARDDLESTLIGSYVVLNQSRQEESAIDIAALIADRDRLAKLCSEQKDTLAALRDNIEALKRERASLEHQLQNSNRVSGKPLLQGGDGDGTLSAQKEQKRERRPSRNATTTPASNANDGAPANSPGGSR